MGIDPQIAGGFRHAVALLSNQTNGFSFELRGIRRNFWENERDLHGEARGYVHDARVLRDNFHDGP